jgi:thiol reductant ABC exporter CydC subunit
VAFGAAGTQLDRSAASDRDLTQIASATARTAGIGLGLTTLLAGLAMWGALVVGISAVHAHHLHGVLLAVIVLIPLAAFELVAPLPTATQTLERVRRCAARVFAVLDADAPVTEPNAPAAVPASPRQIEAHGARARYGATLPWALDAVDLELSAGRRIGVVGPSGAGKSTLAAVLLRFLPYEGSVDLEGVQLDRLAGDDVRSVVGLVAQDAHLFDTSIGENLRIARRDATDPELHAVLRRVHLQDWVATLPQGLATEVGEHGAELSGGQRQRLAVARALLADFPILVLDEPAEHLDLETADAITADVLDVTRGRSTLLITHRLAGLEAVDEVVVIDDGQIVERGTHRDLLRAGGRYATLWRRERDAEPPLADSVHPVVLAPGGAGA